MAVSPAPDPRGPEYYPVEFLDGPKGAAQYRISGYHPVYGAGWYVYDLGRPSVDTLVRRFEGPQEARRYVRRLAMRRVK